MHQSHNQSSKIIIKTEEELLVGGIQKIKFETTSEKAPSETEHEETDQIQEDITNIEEEIKEDDEDADDEEDHEDDNNSPDF